MSTMHPESPTHPEEEETPIPHPQAATRHAPREKPHVAEPPVHSAPSVFLLIGTTKAEGSSMEQIRGAVHGAFTNEAAARQAAMVHLEKATGDHFHLLLLKVPLDTVVNDGDVVERFQR